jgi:hypothetical protein
MSKVYEMIHAHAKKYPGTIAWRKKAHAKVVDKHLNPGEEVLFAFCCQKGFSTYDIFNTYAIVITNKRVIVAQKRLLFGYLFLAITPDMFNDLTIRTGIIWGKACLDTVKEVVVLSNLSKSSVDEIETAITEYMMREKKKYLKVERGAE